MNEMFARVMRATVALRDERAQREDLALTLEHINREIQQVCGWV